MLRSLAIDDEPIALEIIETHAKRVPALKLLNVFTSPQTALDYLRNNPIDLIFLDINMPLLSGLDIATELDKHTMVIFTTAYSEHAIKGYELNVVDYLLKPITFERFYQACMKAVDRRMARLESKPIFVKDGHELARIDPASVLYLESADNYVKVYQKTEMLSIRTSLPELITLINNDYIFRVHRSFAVNLAHVTRINASDIFIANRQIPIGQMYRDDLLYWIKNFH